MRYLYLGIIVVFLFGQESRAESRLTGAEKAKAEAIGAVLRCPVCQGMPIVDSPAKMAIEMMDVVNEKVAAGESEEEIINYFIGRYGEWVLLRPTAEGFNVLVWILPPLALLLAFAFIVYRARGAGKREAVENKSGDGSEDSTLDAVRKEVEL